MTQQANDTQERFFNDNLQTVDVAIFDAIRGSLIVNNMKLS